MYKSIPAQRTEKLTRVHHISPYLAYCPITARQVCGNEQASFLIPGGQANWWHCSACHGWHIFIVDNEKKVRNCL